MDLRPITACFTGHRSLQLSYKETLLHRLSEFLEGLIVYRGYRYFGNGGAIGFDLLAADAVLALKVKYPQVKLIMVLPCPDQTQKWVDTGAVDHYQKILKAADKVTYTSEKYTDACYAIRNQHMVSNSSLVIAYCYREGSGTGQTVRMAREAGLEVVNLA